MMTSAPTSVLPDNTGILHNDQIVDIGEIKIALWKIGDMIEAVNVLALDTGLALRQIPGWPIALMGNDISVLLCLHEKAENRIRAAAFQAVESVMVPA